MRPGDVLAEKYRLEKRLGLGGMGEVWSASHIETERRFAIKVMHARGPVSVGARNRFVREARASAKINHPNVIDIFDVGTTQDKAPYLVMELLEGVPLADVFHRLPPLTIQDFLSIMRDTAGALSAAHSVGIIHRDIKPSNIFLHRERGTGFFAPKVLDFGISKFSDINDSNATQTGAVLGSPRYMSPEQTRSAADVDPRADLWTIGVILFEGLTGTWPHEGDSFSSLVVAICTKPPASIDLVAPGLPEGLRAIVRDCLKPLETRLSSAAELAARLEEALRDPSFAQIQLPRPRHPPSSDVVRSIGSLPIRPSVQMWGAAQGPASSAFPSSAAPASMRSALLAANQPSIVGLDPMEPPSSTQTSPHMGAVFQAGERTPQMQASAEPLPSSEAFQQGQSAFSVFRSPQVGLDPLVGTASTMSVEAAPGPSTPMPVPEAPSTKRSVPPPGSLTASARGTLRVVAAVLGVVLIGLVITVVAVLRREPAAVASPSPSAEATGAPSQEVKPLPPANPTSAAPAASGPEVAAEAPPAPSASSAATESPASAASAAPAVNTASPTRSVPTKAPSPNKASSPSKTQPGKVNAPPTKTAPKGTSKGGRSG
jgi:serine/threonine-protein kinase